MTDLLIISLWSVRKMIYLIIALLVLQVIYSCRTEARLKEKPNIQGDLNRKIYTDREHVRELQIELKK